VTAPDPRAVLSRPAAAPDAVLRYGPAADHLIDVHLPRSRTPAPLVVLMHGGFWRAAFDRRHTRPMACALRDEGYVVVTPEFRRTGAGGGWPATFDDVATVRDRLADLLAQVLPGRVAADSAVLVGHSAGGHLALWWSLTGGGGRVVALAPVADLERAYVDDLDGGAVAALLGGSPADVPERYQAADPAALLRARSIDATVLHGTDDAHVPVSHSRDLTGVDLVELTGVEHFALIDPLSAAWPQVLAAVGRSGGAGRHRLASKA
jgi:acetyl esterase/lipase